MGRHKVPLLTEGQKQGTWLAILIIAMTVSILIGVLFSIYAVNRATSSRATVQELCISGNDSRAQQVQLWEFVITLSVAPPNETHAEKAARLNRVREFRAYLHKVFAPRDCTRLTGR